MARPTCTSGKWLYPDSDSARRAAKAMGKPLGVYYCAECWHWHLTSGKGMEQPPAPARDDAKAWLPKLADRFSLRT